MFTRHDQEFTQVTTATPINGAMLSISSDTLLETKRGWLKGDELRTSDHVATLDGGFVPITWMRKSSNDDKAFLVPAGTFRNCTDVILPGSTRIGMEAPLDFTETTTDMLSVPLSAFEATCGLIPVHGVEVDGITLGLAEEEMIWVNSGMLLHARSLTNPYFHSLSFAQTRVMLAMHDTGMQQAA